MNEPLSIRINQNYAAARWDLYGFTLPHIDGVQHKIMPVSLCVREKHDLIEPMCSIDEGQVQVLMDDLWKAGVRPSKRLMEQTTVQHMEEEVAWNRKVIERLLPAPKYVDGS